MSDDRQRLEDMMNKALNSFDFLDGTYEEFTQGLLTDLEKLIDERRKNPQPDDADSSTLCRHWGSKEKICELGFDDCLDCYCYIAKVVRPIEEVLTDDKYTNDLIRFSNNYLKESYMRSSRTSDSGHKVVR